jgi:hypothetical protein
MKIVFDEQAWHDYLYWQEADEEIAADIDSVEERSTAAPRLAEPNAKINLVERTGRRTLCLEVDERIFRG